MISETHKNFFFELTGFITCINWLVWLAWAGISHGLVGCGIYLTTTTIVMLMFYVIVFGRNTKLL
jgi:hypothetical protein